MREVLQILNDEFRLSMALSGRRHKKNVCNPADVLCGKVSTAVLCLYCNKVLYLSHPGCRNVAEINRNLIQFSKL